MDYPEHVVKVIFWILFPFFICILFLAKVQNENVNERFSHLKKFFRFLNKKLTD